MNSIHVTATSVTAWPKSLTLAMAMTFSGFVAATPMPAEQETQQAAATATNSTPVARAQAEQQSSDDADVSNGAQKQRARTVITLESTFVGDKEQPKVTTIVPWQKPEQMAVSSKAMSQRVKMTFQPLEADSLKRELKYHKQATKQ